MSRHSAYRTLAALASAGVLSIGGAAGASVADAASAHAAGKTIKVTAIDYKFKLSAGSLSRPGKVTFKITNKGHIAHDFKIDGKTSKMLQPGKSATLTVTFKKKGSYPYLCTVPGHAQLGMKGKFKVS